MSISPPSLSSTWTWNKQYIVHFLVMWFLLKCMFLRRSLITYLSGKSQSREKKGNSPIHLHVAFLCTVHTLLLLISPQFLNRHFIGVLFILTCQPVSVSSCLHVNLIFSHSHIPHLMFSEQKRFGLREILAPTMHTCAFSICIVQYWSFLRWQEESLWLSWLSSELREAKSI